jgi:hypothetical protein
MSLRNICRGSGDVPAEVDWLGTSQRIGRCLYCRRWIVVTDEGSLALHVYRS